MKLFPDEEIKLKICGLSKESDIIKCTEIGVNALGFLLGDSKGKSPSDKLTISQAKQLVSVTPKSVASVLLIKESKVDEIISITEEISPNCLQLQAKDISLETLSKLRKAFPNIELIKTFHIDDTADILALKVKILEFEKYVDAVLFDSQKGGSGKTHNWDISKTLSSIVTVPIVFAGGLNPSNLESAISLIKPKMVDIMSGVSLDKGIKDIDAIKILMSIVNKNK